MHQASSKRTIAVAFCVIPTPQEWFGGVTYFRNLLKSLETLPGEPVRPMLLAGTRGDPEAYQFLPRTEIIRTTLLDRWSPAWVARKLSLKVGPDDLLMQRLLLRRGVECLSHSRPLCRRGRLAVLSWIPDFQHLHLPHLFPVKQVAFRNRTYGAMCRCATLVILSSRDALADLQTFDASAVSKARVLRFVADTRNGETPTELAGLRHKYRLPERFFHLPNQFWAHKNHRVVLEALPLLNHRGVVPTVVMTGNTHDNRNPLHFPALLQQIETLGLKDQVRILGRVTFADLLGLMTHAVALINPSLFEGWSTTVEEAKSLGKRMILSNIRVHVEQNPPGGLFFDPNDPNDLAMRLAEAWMWPPGHDTDLMVQAQDRLQPRIETFAREYVQIVQEATEPSPSGLR